MSAQELSPSAPRPVLARALGSLPSRAVVKFVARNAAPIKLDPETNPALRQATAREVIEYLCGSVQDGYMAELVSANQLSEFQMDSPLGERAFTLQWPACLNVHKYVKGSLTYAVKTRDTLTAIRQKFTGTGAFDPKRLDTFFGLTDRGIDAAAPLKPGDRFDIPYTTAATVLYPTAPVPSFLAGLNAAGAGSIAVDGDPKSPGGIVGPVKFTAPGPSTGSTQGSFAPCDRGDASRPYPFDGAAIEQAYRVTLASTKRATFPVTIVLVDDGFFGTPCSASACPEMDGDHVKSSDRFPRDFFDDDQFAAQDGYGPKLSGTNIQPLNFWNKTSAGAYYTPADINTDTGHGTHVAGLSLGGPLFVKFRSVFFSSPSKPWLTLAIVNLSNGSPKLALGSDRNLAGLLQTILGVKIVNMSIAFDGHADASIAGTISGAVSNDPRSLFVVAAGNRGGLLDDDANEFYPARLGGGAMSARNVITVASVDGPLQGIQRLSVFSDRSNNYVDIAAPGCQIASWLDDGGPPAEISGTSQATPIVTFAATLLTAMWRTDPAQIKNRLLYSSDLLDRDDDRANVRSGGQLNIEKALTYLWDRITYTRDHQSHTYLGSLSLLQGLKCDGGAEVQPRDIKALKRSGENKFVIYRVDSAQTLHLCRGTADPQTAVTLTAVKEVVGNSFLDKTLSTPIQGSEIQEVIRAH